MKRFISAPTLKLVNPRLTLVFGLGAVTFKPKSKLKIATPKTAKSAERKLAIFPMTYVVFTQTLPILKLGSISPRIVHIRVPRTSGIAQTVISVTKSVVFVI